MRDVLNELNITIAPEGHHHTSHGRVQIDCPFCSPNSGRWRLGLKEERSRWCHCWTCGSHDVAQTLAECANLPVNAVYPLLGRLPKDFAVQRTPAAGKVALPGMRYGKLQRPHRNFLRARGFDPKHIAKFWKLDAFAMHPRFAWRIFIPITLDGEVVSWTTRSIHDADTVPYLSAKPEEERVCHKDVLYGEEYCTNTIVIQEGPLDVWALGPGSVCTFGTQYSTTQLLRMSRYPRRIVLFDNEPAAQKVARKLCDDLSVFDGETTNVTFESGKDASRASKEEIAQFRERFLPTLI